MGPKLRVSVGPSRDQLGVVATNYDLTGAQAVKSEFFEGQIAVRIRDFTGEVGQGKAVRGTTESEYFDKHANLTWSMAIQGRFKKQVNADDVLFGNVFEHPIRDRLPYGTAAALKFVNYVDPALEQDVYADKPWALSPLIATMNHMLVQPLSDPSNPPAWSAEQPEDDIAALYPSEAQDKVANFKGNAAQRRTYYSKKDARKEVLFKPDQWLNLDFCNGYLDFNTFSLKIPGGLHYSLMKYWDGQPVTYVCRSRDGKQEYFFIVFEIIDETAIGKRDAGEFKEEKAKDDEERKAQQETTQDSAPVDDLGVD